MPRDGATISATSSASSTLDAAKAAIRFEKPMLSAIDARVDDNRVHYSISDKPLTAEEWTEKYVKPN
jgi:hypothetical protein